MNSLTKLQSSDDWPGLSCMSVGGFLPSFGARNSSVMAQVGVCWKVGVLPQHRYRLDICQLSRGLGTQALALSVYGRESGRGRERVSSSPCP